VLWTIAIRLSFFTIWVVLTFQIFVWRKRSSLFKVTLVWSDYASTESAATNLVNDLDLIVTLPGEYLQLQLPPPTPQPQRPPPWGKFVN
jgi:hypothetical protein